MYRDLFISAPYFFVLANFIFGLLVGSFLNVVAIRVPLKRSVITPPSHCTSCKHRLGIIDLIPVISYLLLGRKCRYCGQPISAQYAVWEAAAGLLFAVVSLAYGPSKEWLVALFFVSILIVITQTDLRHMLIPDKVVFFGVAVSFMLRIWNHPLPFSQYIWGMVTGFGLLFLIALVSVAIVKKEAMGGGDIKLFAFIGLTLGLKLTLLTLFFACLIGTLFGMVLLSSGVWKRDQYIPFGPYIALGALLSLLAGDRLIDWYMGLLV
ncbi:prepilin peptidase [Paenibacillus thalictri]|uniref:Prepilin leader peptidase/N-methyltransferase n=2 Tax=Paenibacillus thalictri TaxID=2527873 RepID=A0A4Q9DWU4_9BACL|nr:prepilin peptidase [Paenibacillus thalictri]